jgi:hypothetical protein
MLVWCEIPEDDLRKIETRCSRSGLYVKAHILMLIYLLLLSVKMFINARVGIQLSLTH